MQQAISLLCILQSQIKCTYVIKCKWLLIKHYGNGNCNGMGCTTLLYTLLLQTATIQHDHSIIQSMHTVVFSHFLSNWNPLDSKQDIQNLNRM